MVFIWTYILNIRIIISLIIFNIEGFPEAKHGVILLKVSRNDIGDDFHTYPHHVSVRDHESIPVRKYHIWSYHIISTHI